MTYRQQNGSGDLIAILQHQEKAQAKKIGINKIKDLIDWESFRNELEEILGYVKREKSKGGRPPFDPVFMFKILILQKYYGLSDDATEEQIEDRASFMGFLDLKVGDHIPDAKTIWEFRQRLEANGMNGSQRLFTHFEKNLTAQGIIGREGSIVDASFVAAPRQRNTREQNEKIKAGERPEGFEQSSAKGKQKDCEARWAVKNKEVHYGYKNHIKADAKTKLIINYSTTPANVHDSQEFQSLVDENDQAVLADSAYSSEASETHLHQCDCEEFLMKKGKRGTPLNETEQQTNKKISRIRVRVEHIFGHMKQKGMDYVRSIGLNRAHQHNGLSNLAYNLTRYAFLKTAQA
jgi:IS5 family transposase